MKSGELLLGSVVRGWGEFRVGVSGGRGDSEFVLGGGGRG